MHPVTPRQALYDTVAQRRSTLRTDWHRTQRALQNGCREGLHLGGQIYVSLDGDSVLARPFGEVRPGVAMRSDHLLAWLSASKPVAVVAIAQLREKGLLDLDDRIAEHIPEFGCRGKEPITLRHVLTHTGGFRLLDVGWPNAPWEQIIERICRTRLDPGWIPGQTAGYHLTSSWFILGELVRRLDGRPFEHYVREEIFLRLEMDDSWIGMPVARYRAYGDRIAPLFDTSSRGAGPLAWHAEKRVTRCSPGSNGRGPVAELGRFYEMLLTGGCGPDSRILQPETIDELTRRHRIGLVDKTFRRPVDWGLGFVRESSHFGRHASGRAFGHGGFRSSIAFADPEHALVVALIFNGAPGDAAHRRRGDAVLAAIYEDLGLAH